MNEAQPTLSSEGRIRRERILVLAVAEARHRRRRRVVARVAVAGLILAVLIPWMLQIRTPEPVNVAIRRHESPASPIQPTGVTITRITTDPNIIERLALPPQPSRVIVIGDLELLAELAEAHQSAGLAYVNGKAMLLYR